MMTKSKSNAPIEVLTDDVKSQIDHWVAKFPGDKQRSASLMALTIVQKANGGHLTAELMNEVADYLQLPRIQIYEVATFYDMFEHKPVGKYKIEICTNISCDLCGAKEMVQFLESKTGAKLGGTSADGKYTLKPVECLGACCGAPMFKIDNKYYEKLSNEKIDSILNELD